MVWQDLVIGTVNILLIYALIPQIYGGIKKQRGLINIQTSTISTASIFVLGIMLLTLKLYFAAGTTLIESLLWCILLMQKLIYKT